jgi:hypothetical protein
LIKGMGFDPAADDVPDCPEVFMDVAVAQLEQGGIVRAEELAELLFDETNDYRIEITDEDRRCPLQQKTRCERSRLNTRRRDNAGLRPTGRLREFANGIRCYRKPDSINSLR